MCSDSLLADPGDTEPKQSHINLTGTRGHLNVKEVMGPLLEPMLFSIFINDGIERTVSKFGDDTELIGVADTPDGCAPIQRDLYNWRTKQTGNSRNSGNGA
ncbi:hypothetical protein llap_10860 [Limosa lapponica baueri]|uniref:Rna-directed dna polymerase from mobile element jockey-like n=1 Tax=Limosa lapponica baueri TaxID=1758121 RepID=A0A2I0TYE6_LIMLA|nr:hypothetical protein llap_10860 [Limosa lapponica baueri]